MAVVAVAAVVAGVYYVGFRYRGSEPLPPRDVGPGPDRGAIPLLSTDRPEPANGDSDETLTKMPERGALPWADDQTPASSTPQPERALSLLKAAREASARGDVLVARSHLSDALREGLPPSQTIQARAELVQIGDETIFSSRVTPGDPFVESYIIRPGDTLAKIANAYDITADLLARINGIEDKNRIRAGQNLKVIRGPFHVIVTRSTFDLDVYLQNTFLKHFKVGLGAEQSTPLGEWVVETKLKNPTYHPARGGRIIAADDPENPLGERWIGLKGVAGEAKGQERYGIHGTIEPDSIGRAVSLGCIRMHNPDVELLFDMLVVGKSRVVVRE
jgi:lipoprotein-anchoring transpeptidase ErfK/SrfK